MNLAFSLFYKVNFTPVLEKISCSYIISELSELDIKFDIYLELPCPMCGKLFHNKKYLDRHARQVHTQQADMKFK